jgi:hypothetical protein
MVLVLTLSAGTGYACKCAGHDLAGDIAHSDAVFIGKVVIAEINNPFSTFTFEVKKVYKGNAIPGERYIITQGGSSCTRRIFMDKETYLIFSEKNEVSQCNLSGRVENNHNVLLLDSIYKNKYSALKGADEDLKLLTNRYISTILLSDHSDGNGKATELAIDNKKVVFFDGITVWLGKNSSFESDNKFYPTNYYLAADSKNSKWLRETGADYLIYVTNMHQGMTMKPGWMNEKKPKPKVYKKIKAITSI